MTTDCLSALRHWKIPSIFVSGTPLRVVSSRKVTTTEASVKGWGAVHEGRVTNRLRSPQLRHTRKNYLKLLFHLKLSHPGQNRQYYWWHTSTTRMALALCAYTDCQEYSVEQCTSLITRDSCPGCTECGSGLVVQGESQIWERFTVDCFAERHAPSYAFSSMLDPPLSEQSEGTRLIPHLRASRQPGKLWLAEITQLPLRRDLLAQANKIFHPAPGTIALWAWPMRG